MRTIQIGHSPDADDLFMYYAIAFGWVGNTIAFENGIDLLTRLKREKPALIITDLEMPGGSGDYVVRKLSPVECERLQTLPDNYTEGVPDSKRIKAIGNGWTVDVIAHIFTGLREKGGNYKLPESEEE